MTIHPHAAECPRRQDALDGRAEQARHLFTPGPWAVSEHRHDGRLVIRADDGHTTIAYVAVGEGDESEAQLIAAAPYLYAAAAKHLEWIEKEHAGPQYGELTRDTHPLGEAIWQQWWNEQLDLCGDTEALCRAALAKARGGDQ